MEFIDQLNRTVVIQSKPERIVSVVPSQTELLVDLGLKHLIVGVTKFCIHPTNLRRDCAVIGGTKNLNIEKIKLLNPDFILANKEENDASQIQELAKYFPVWISDMKNLNESMEMIGSVGSITGSERKAKKMSHDILEAFDTWGRGKNDNFNLKPSSTGVYLIWNNPLMTVNHDTFINDMITRFGLINLFANHNESRYPIISETELIESAPDFLLLSSEPYPFGKEHKVYFERLLPRTKLVLVDGEMFSWYGSRLLLVPDYFKRLFQDMDS